MIETFLQRVLFVNSGGFKLCDIDLSKSLHLYGGNNAGKTTIVNALQFAFVDNFKQMVWDGHKDDETKKHYFDSYSYIVFEVSTPTGPQCLTLLGQGPGQSFGFQRWRYNGILEKDAYVDIAHDGKLSPRDNQYVKSYFAKMEAKGPLSGKEIEQWITGRGQTPFSVAPLKRANDFSKYKKVFTNLLRLEKLTALEMRGLLVACSDVVTNELDLREKYENRYNEFIGKQNEILMINNARNTLENCITDYERLSSKRSEYSKKYNYIRKFAEDEKRRLSIDLKTITQELSESSKVDIEKETEIESLIDKIDLLKENQFTIKKSIMDLEDKITRANGLSELELTANKVSLSKTCEDLAAATQQSKYSNLETNEKSLLKQISSLEAQLSGETSLRDLIRNRISESPELFSIWDKILSGELLQLIEGSDFSLTSDEAFNSLLNSITLDDKSELEISGISIELAKIDTNPIPETNEQLQQLLSELTDKISITRQAIIAKKESERIRNELTNARKELNVCIEDLTLLQQLPILVKNLQSENINKGEIESSLSKLNIVRKKLTEERMKYREDMVKKENESNKLTIQIQDVTRELQSIHPPSDYWAEKDMILVDGNNWSIKFKQIEQLNSRCKEAYRKLHNSLDSAHKVTDGRFRNEIDNQAISDMKIELESLDEKKEVNDRLQNSLVEGMKNDIRNFMTSYDSVIKKISAINKSFGKISISNLDWFKLDPSPNATGIIAAMEKIREEDTLLAFGATQKTSRGSLDLLFTKGKMTLEDIFEVNINISVNGVVKKFRDIGRFESQGTTIAVKVCFHVEILKNMMKPSIGRIPIFLDELEKLDDKNIQSIVQYVHDAGLNLITASPRPKSVIPLNYWLDRSGFVLDKHKAEWE
jgi:hypothetical protein